MNTDKPLLIKRLWVVSFSLMLVLLAAMFLGLSLGSSQSGIKAVFQNLLGIGPHDPMLDTIIWQPWWGGPFPWAGWSSRHY